MKALTLTQPWATLVAIGAKHIETRSWFSPYRGELAIHAAKGWTAEDKALCYEEPFKSALSRFLDIYRPIESQLPMGAVVATCKVLNVIPVSKLTWDFKANDVQGPWPHGFEIEDPNNEYTFGNYGENRFAWLLGDIKILCKPLEARGQQGLWNWPGEPGKAA